MAGAESMKGNTMKADMMKFTLTHRHSGPGWAVVQELPDDMCRVVQVGKEDIGKQAFLAWNKFLEVWKMKDTTKPNHPMVPIPIPGKAMEMLSEIRADLKSGKRIVKSTHIVLA